jgi:hypothetical protein
MKNNIPERLPDIRATLSFISRACNSLVLYNHLTLRISGRRKQAKRRFRLSGACVD